MINSIIKKNYFKKKLGTAIAIGPVSKNTIIAVNEISKEKKVPLMLIASRRQIETKNISSGYVDNFTTEKYSNFVKKFRNKRIILCRDHGGPYQGADEKKFSKSKAMQQAKISLKSDIDNDFKILHIDPSIGPYNKEIPKNNIIEDIMELIEFSYKYSLQKKKKVFFEIGTEEPSCFTGSFNELNGLITEIIDKLKFNKLPKPLFCVLQTGTRVKELSNIGDLNNLKLINRNIYKIKKISEICKKNNIQLKQHNTDYLRKEILKKLPSLNIDAANVAPEFGYVESLAIYNFLRKFNQNKILEKFLELSFKSNKWKKWLKTNSKLTDLEKSLLAGHYIFGTNSFKNLKKEIKKTMPSTYDFDAYLILQVKKRINYYMMLFNYY